MRCGACGTSKQASDSTEQGTGSAGAADLSHRLHRLDARRAPVVGDGDLPGAAVKVSRRRASVRERKLGAAAGTGFQ